MYTRPELLNLSGVPLQPWGELYLIRNLLDDEQEARAATVSPAALPLAA